jgi:signal transduction histidine kinase
MSLPKKSTNGALDELIESEERLRSVIKSAIDAVNIVDSNGKIISLNNRAERHFLEISIKHGEGTIFTFTLPLKRKGVTG